MSTSLSIFESRNKKVSVLEVSGISFSIYFLIIFFKLKIKDHKYIPQKYLLEIPGLCDLSYYVDFQNMISTSKNSFGIKSSLLEQVDFLLKNGLKERFENFALNLSNQEASELES